MIRFLPITAISVCPNAPWTIAQSSLGRPPPRGLRELGVSILLVEQNARAALETADYGYVLETGCIVHAGPAVGLIHDPRVIASYLGGKVH
jgi:hypothetical protein